MASFSQRYGYKPIKSIVQVESMDDDLRVGLWNVLESCYWSNAKPDKLLTSDYNRRILRLTKQIWADYFGLPVDTIDVWWTQAYEHLRKYYFGCSWNEIYDFVEFVANDHDSEATGKEFRRQCNTVLKREVSGYRFVGERIVQVTAEQEVAEIEEALTSTQISEPAKTHLRCALQLFSDRHAPDYRNSIKESISAVEAISSRIAGKDRAELGDALKVLSDRIRLHGALRQGFSNLYGYTSDAEGIRHALLEETELDFEDAKFMLVACSAFVNYLKVKASKAGVELDWKS